MNTWDAKPSITVIFGAEDVPDFAIGEVVKDVMSGIEHWVTSTISNGTYDYEVHNADRLSPDHLSAVINSLDDHVNNVKIEDWLSHNNDLCVDKEEWLWVNIATGTYYGPNCEVQVYYVSI